jgi:hypothetical protein
MEHDMNIRLHNNDSFGNNFRVTDSNNGNSQIFSGYINAHEDQWIVCRENDSGYGNIITYQDNNSGIGRSFLKEGETVDL